MKLKASSEWDSRFGVDNIKRPNTNPWHGRGNGTNQWITFEFDDFTEVTGFRYKAHAGWDGSSFKNFNFDYYSESNSAWQTFHHGQGSNLDCCQWKKIWLTMSPKAKRFRLYMIDDWGYNWLSIQQLQLETTGCWNGIYFFIY